MGGAKAEIGVLQFLKNTCDCEFGKENYTWSTVGAGYPQEFYLGALSIILGGNVRVGMEDNLRVAENRHAKSNAELVAKAVKIIESLDREVAKPEDARKILGLKGRENTNF